ncbi:PA2169 family four-helix-bundle protein [Chitinophaga rhizophila]|uniref:PA2169 family four-helix-bundle protein n=1 Tax=Chitinophaga rhizophila TaxID=2866212 RepID=A0ABS7GE84_9BACT|nr:PA2169 family four-helix-bundle protein [Chitinophaga rhizophila]MBW8685977.1 PA2169 family four-helix-bundle protein [Chitinophaga rhizophila]
MQLNEKLLEALNDLVRINRDRVEGYRKAIDQTDDADLKALFQRMADESNSYIDQLNMLLLTNGEGATMQSSIYGRIYRTWMDVKATFSGPDRHSILSSCEYGEGAAQRTYEEILRSSIPMPYSVRELIANQKGALRSSHDTVRTYRELEKVAH